MRDKFHRGLTRLIFRFFKLMLGPLELVRPRLYMMIYGKILRCMGIKFEGKPRYISTKAYFDDFELVTLGERAVISKNVTFLTHDYSLTTALIACGEHPSTDIAIHRPIVVGRNVFIGMGAIVMPGVTIGDNVIIGAGSVVRGNIEPDSIFAGNPANKVGSILGNRDVWLARAKGEFVRIDKV